MTSEYSGPSVSYLHGLLSGVECLLLDFDGPVCRLFSGYPAGDVAATMRAYLADHGRPVTDAGLIVSTDPHEILRAVTDSALSAGMELLLTEAEEKAARVAEPTLLADAFIRAVVKSGRAVAITTNNAPSAVDAYLQEHDLKDVFEQRIFGRSTKDPALMKPHPDCLLRAVEAVGVRAEACLMIGDSVADAEAARAANVPFLGCVRSKRRVARLQGAEFRPVVVGMSDLAAAAAGLSVRPNG
ncbi:HAD family hydrolase [Actinacidiphila alni]|uniref:HAD family hydrolase n=1 Tax=Actinacidiphila alni TaxID=380248 RepID=UPI003455592A